MEELEFGGLGHRLLINHSEQWKDPGTCTYR
jgi:hypothetical protein